MSVTLRQLLEEPVRTPPFIVFPLLPVGGKLFLYAPKKHFKSMLMFNLLYDLAEGEQFLFNWRCERAYTVLLVEQEIGSFMCRSRFDRIQRGRNGRYAMDNINICSKERTIKLDTDAGVQRLRGEIERTRPQIVALDPIRKFHRQDENNSTAITGVIDALDSLVEEFGVTFIIAHHSGHESMFQQKHMRGSSVWGDEADTIINLSRPVQRLRNKLRLEVEEIRHAAQPDAMDLEFDTDTFTFTRSVQQNERREEVR